MPTAFVSTLRCRVENLLIHTESLILELRVLLLTTDRIAGSDEKKEKKKDKKTPQKAAAYFTNSS